MHNDTTTTTTRGEDGRDALTMAGCEMLRHYGFTPLDRALWARSNGPRCFRELAQHYPEARKGRV